MVREPREQMAHISQEVRISFDEVEAFQARVAEGGMGGRARADRWGIHVAARRPQGTGRLRR